MVVDTNERRVVAQIEVGVEPEGMAVSHDGRWAVTTSETTNMVHWIDTVTHEIVANTLVCQRPRYARFSANDKLLWVTSEIDSNRTLTNAGRRRRKDGSECPRGLVRALRALPRAPKRRRVGLREPASGESRLNYSTRISQCAQTARVTSGGRFHPGSCRLIW